MRYFIFIFLMTLMSCNTPLEKVLKSKNPAIKDVQDSIENYEVQIIYTQIDTSETGEILFKDHTYQVDETQYFYPASTVKLPVAILAAEYADTHNDLSIDVPYVTDRDSLKHTIAQDIEAIFTVSDNEAYNRLYEILGRDYMNNRFREKSLTPIQINHRLSTSDAANPQRSTTKFFPGYSADVVVLENQKDKAITPLKLNRLKKGTGFIAEGELVTSPMDFSEKNYFPLTTQHELMKRLIFPDEFPENQRFTISEQTRTRLLTMMKTLPKDAGYTSKEYYDSYVKFFMYGDSKDPIPQHITIYNKVGYAYGTLTETAYIVDQKEGIRFLLSATILVNKNGIFNDDTYEYEDVGIPFLAQLGRELYQIEKDRNN